MGLERENRKYCSRECAGTARKVRTPKPTLYERFPLGVVVCGHCGKLMLRPLSKIERQERHFCSAECHREHTRAVWADYHPTHTSVDKDGYLRREEWSGGRRVKRVYVHREVVESVLGRSLIDGEVVHHINGNKRDNSPGNLMVMDNLEHSIMHGRNLGYQTAFF